MLSPLKSLNHTSVPCTARLPPTALDDGIAIGSKNWPWVVMRPRNASLLVKNRTPGSGPWAISVRMQESIVYMHAIVFMVAAGYTLQHDGHVRCDVFYAAATPQRKALVDLIARAHIYLDRLTGPSAMNTTSIAEEFNVDRADVGRILPLAFLSPRMLDAILSGSQPASLTPRYLARTELPINWAGQNTVLQ